MHSPMRPLEDLTAPLTRVRNSDHGRELGVLRRVVGVHDAALPAPEDDHRHGLAGDGHDVCGGRGTVN